MIESMLDQGATTFIEVGPGRILSGLIRSISASYSREIVVQPTDGMEEDGRTLARAVAVIASRGYPIQLSAWKPRQQRPSMEGKGPAVWLRGANLRPGEGLPAKDARPVPGPPANLDTAPTKSIQAPLKTVSTRGQQGNTIENPLASSPSHSEQHSTDLLDQQEALMNVIEKAQEIRELLDRSQRSAEETLAQSLTNEVSPVPSISGHETSEAVPAATISPPENSAPERLDQSVPKTDLGGEAPFSANERTDLVKFMTEVVAEKTGYPFTAIDPTMDLEADLGIDSIKRVEILSAVRQQNPDLPTLSPEILGSLRTIDALVDHFQPDNEIPSGEPLQEATSAIPPAIEPDRSFSKEPDNTLANLIVQVVAEKTGYPDSAIDVNLDLESDLGIDSIKRVEILSALRQQRPDLEALPAETLGSLRTIASIVDHYGGDLTQSTNEDSNSSPTGEQIDHRSTATSQSRFQSASSSGLEDLLIRVISEKTGYPTDAIATDLDLEGDLGIDSIKRVEILSALKQERSDLPTLPPEQLGTLRTILQLVEALSSPQTSSQQTSTPEVVDATPAIPAIIDSTPPQKPDEENTTQDSLIPLLLNVISEKTGYPEDAIGVDLDLESDLGIDSIKRVEILSALRQHRPDLPAIPAEKLATLRTIQQIAGWYKDSHPQSALEGSFAKDTVPPAESGSGHVDASDLPRSSSPLILARSMMRNLSPLNTATERSLCWDAEWWVIGNDSNIREGIATQLEKRNVKARHCPLQDHDLFRSSGAQIGGIILVASLEPDESEPLELFRWIQEAGRRLGNHSEVPTSLHVITRLGGEFGCPSDQTRGDLPVVNPLGGALLGMTRCAAREWDEVVVRGIDLEADDRGTNRAVEEVVTEIFHGEETWVGLTSAGRMEWNLDHFSPAPPGPSPIGTGDLVIVSGGARGVTYECLESLTRDAAPALYLLGRTPAPGNEPDWALGLQDDALESRLFELASGTRSPAEIRREATLIRQSRQIQSRIDLFRSRGCDVTYHSVDVRQRQALASILAEARQRHGEVRGIIHGAGVLADSWIVDKSEEDFLKVWQTKVDPALHLLDLCSGDDLSLIQFFSSTTATLGRKGQADYAAANETLNQLARREAHLRPQCHVSSIGWGPWDGGMVESGLKDLFHSEGVGLIDLPQGAAHFVSQTRTSGPFHHIALRSHGDQPNFLQSISEFPEPKVSRRDTRTFSTPEKTNSSVSADPVWEEQLQLDISCESDPTLRDHVLQGRAVIPAALLVEWCAQVATHRNPGLEFIGVDNFRVLKGVVMGGRRYCPTCILLCNSDTSRKPTHRTRRNP